LTVVISGSQRYFRIGIIAGVLAILVDFGLELALLRQLSVFNTALGLWVFISGFLATAALLLILIFIGSFLCAALQKNTGSRKAWIVYYIILGLSAFGAFASGLNGGLSLDVIFSTYTSKAGLDYLSLQYLNGAVIWTTLLLVALFMLSDPRVSYVMGSDGKRRFYMHSKFLGLVRLFRNSNLLRAIPRRRRYFEPAQPTEPLDWDVGETMDHSVLSKNGRLRWNDMFPVRSTSFLVWTSFKFLIALAIAASIANGLALRIVTIQNYLNQTNSSWIAQIGDYFGILGLRLSGTYQVSPTFGITNVFTFEVFKLILSLLGLAFIVLGLRLGISMVANFIVGVSKRALGMSRKALSDLFAIILLPFVYVVLGSGAWVYDVGSAFILWTLVLALVGFAFLTGIMRAQRVFSIKMTKVTGIVIIVLILVAGIAPTSFGSFLRSQSGQYIAYQWDPAYVPTIQYTRWAYGIDNISSAGLSLVNSSSTQTNVLNHIRIFTNEAARLNMKPSVGVNWMSITNAPVDIIYINGTEYWVSMLQLVEANYANDVDVWRTQHLLLTHSEKVVAVNAASTAPANMTAIWNLTQTPQIYYGEGGLWQSVDEVYLNIPGFNETHLANYIGPASYNGQPDYTYQGFWLYWKFFWQGRFDFANGDYGNIKALEYRDVNSRLSNILLPNMQMDPDPYPVVDKSGNIYLLHWIWIDWQSPSDFADYPEHTQTSILRLFAVTLTDVKTGAITGYLYNNGKTDYVTSFYRSMYPQWNQPVPSWLTPQVRYPESYFNTQQDVYNFYFQTDPLQWQRNVFLQSTEDTRFIITPINGKLAWAAVRLVEIYQSPSQNLAGLYIAPAGNQTGTVYLIRFPEGMTVLGPNSAQSAVTTDPTVKSQLTLHPDWTSGNMLLYFVNGQLIYVIPYYGTQFNLIVPVMVAVVNAQTKQVGSALFTPNNYAQVQGATANAIANLGVVTGAGTTINGTIAYRDQYVVNGNTRWILGINPTGGGSTIQVYAKAEALTPDDIAKISNATVPGGSISVVVDSSNNVLKVNSST